MIYNFIIALYTSAVRLAALFNKKVALMVKGEKEAFGILEKQIVRGEKYLWFHAASLGEFEQGRPLIEEIRKKYPQYKILLLLAFRIRSTEALQRSGHCLLSSAGHPGQRKAFPGSGPALHGLLHQV